MMFCCTAEPPVFITFPRDANLTEGDTATIHCRAIGSPRPAIQWIFNGAPLSTSSAALVQGIKPVAGGRLSLGCPRVKTVDSVFLCAAFSHLHANCKFRSGGVCKFYCFKINLKTYCADKKIKDRNGVKINYLAKCLVCGHCFRKSSSGHTPDRLLYLDHRVVDIIMDFCRLSPCIACSATVAEAVVR